MTATSAYVLDRRADLRRRAAKLGWSQNALARRAGRDPGHFSRVLAGARVSRVAWAEAERVLRRAERRVRKGG